MLVEIEEAEYSPETYSSGGYNSATKCPFISTDFYMSYNIMDIGLISIYFILSKNMY